ncbi:MAG: PAS domain-containing protein [Thermodesulfobacteriota bacterium]
MADETKTREVLLAELAGMDQKIVDLAKSMTKFQRLAEAWRDLWEQFAAIVEAFDGFIYVCSQNYEVEFMNQRFIDRTGYYPLGQKCYKALHDRDDICPWCVNERVFKGETVRWEVLSPKDHRWYYVVNTPIKHPDGTRSKMAMIQDITAQKEMEKARKLAEEKYRGIFENAVEGIFQSSPEGRFLSVNPAMARIFGYASPGEMLAGINDISRQLYVDPRRRDDFRQVMEEAGLVQGFEAQMHRRDGSRMRVAINARAVKDEEGEVLYYEGFVQEITERHQGQP